MKTIKINCKIMKRYFFGSVNVEHDEKEILSLDITNLNYKSEDSEDVSQCSRYSQDNYIIEQTVCLGTYNKYFKNYISYILDIGNMKVCETTGLYVPPEELVKLKNGKTVLKALSIVVDGASYEICDASNVNVVAGSGTDISSEKRYILNADLGKYHKCSCGRYADDEHWHEDTNECLYCFTPRKVQIDTYIYGKHIIGFALYNEKNDSLDVSHLIQEIYRGETLEIVFWDDLVYYEGTAMGTYRELMYNYVQYFLDNSDYSMCDETGLCFHRDDLFYVESSEQLVYKDLVGEYEGEYYMLSDFVDVEVRTSTSNRYSTSIPTQVLSDNYSYCPFCACYVYYDNFDADEDCCIFCSDERGERVIEEYCASHRHNEDPKYFGDYEEGNFQGLGFELEVNHKTYGKDHNSVASRIIEEAGLEECELRYANDGSIGNGFEIISEPHTIKCFWEKQENWVKMLKFLVSEEYRSHISGLCGLHIHVSRKLLGATKHIQDITISKLYSFYEDNWDDLVKISRRESFAYCEKNYHSWEGREMFDKTHSKVKSWNKTVKSNHEGTRGHYVALNNANKHTFEFRLGRGTLNAWSFFSWIDLHITLCKNAKRITVNKVETNDIISWLSGIKESTAKYLYKRGAWKNEMLILYPNIEWEGDVAERV